MNPLSVLLVRNFCRKRVELNLEEAIISFTFDDVAESAVTTGAGSLDKHRVSGTFYVAPGLCGNEGPHGRFASEGDIKALASVGHEIGSHTFSHVSVGSLSRRALAIETMRSIEVLQSMTGRSAVDHFAYPYGEITLSAKRWLARSFVTMRSIFPGVNVGRIDLSALRAVPLYQRAIDEEQIDRWICRNLSSAGWLIFYTHDVSETPSPYGVSTALFEAAVSKAVASGARVLNVEQACRVIRGSSSGLGGRALRE